MLQKKGSSVANKTASSKRMFFLANVVYHKLIIESIE